MGLSNFMNHFARRSRRLPL